MPASYLIALLLCGVGLAAPAAGETEPDVEFIEYLGLWEESDEDWQLLDVIPVDGTGEQEEPAPESEERTETIIETNAETSAETNDES